MTKRGERSKRLRLPMDFEEAVSDLLQVKPPPKPEKKPAKASLVRKRAVKKR